MDKKGVEAGYGGIQYHPQQPYPDAPYPSQQRYAASPPSPQQRSPATPSSPQQHSPAQQGLGYPNQGNYQQVYPAPSQGYPGPQPQPPAYYPPAEPQSAFAVTPPASQDDPPKYESGFGNPTAVIFSDKLLRRAFIRKVYLTLMVQLTITVAIICMFIYWKAARNWVQHNSWFSFALFPATFILLLVLACCEKIRRQVPMNFLFLGLFTSLEGLMLGAVAAFYNAEAVMWAVGATAFVSFGLSLFAFQTKWDFTMGIGILWTVCLVFIAFGILCAIIRQFWLQIVYASLGTLIFAIYLVVDTQLMLGGKHKYSLNPEEYIFAALNLYLDIINIFLFILTLIGLSR